MTHIKWQKRWRTTMDGLVTVLGLRRAGFFSPYRFAGKVDRLPPGYPAWEALFAAHETTTFAETLDIVAADADALNAAIAGPLATHWNGRYLGSLDIAVAFSLVRSARPSQIIEVGSGQSTHILSGAVRSAGLETRIRCIDPAPRAEISALDVEWTVGVLSSEHIALFAALGAGDIAFFDSSHLLFQGTDVDIIQNRILPALARGVLVHFHDIFLPDPYPGEWRLREYTEQLGLSGWLLSGAYEPLIANAYVCSRMADRVASAFADIDDPRRTGSSLWIRRKSPT